MNDFNGNQGIIDLKGNIVVELIYKELGKTLDDKFLNYSTLDNYIVARKSEKYGLISISSGKTIIDFKYDDIKISKYNNFAVKNGEYWYFIDNKENEIFPTGYESIDIYEETLLVSLDKKAFLLDDLGNVISNKVDLYYDVNPWATITVAGLRSYEENNTIFLEIEIPTSETAGTYKKITYRYDDIVKRFVEN